MEEEVDEVEEEEEAEEATAFELLADERVNDSDGT